MARSPFLALLVCLLPLRLGAQTLVGHAVDAETGVPLEGAFVILLGEDGTRHARLLTRGEGRFVVRAPGPGSYRIRVERFGYALGEEGPLSLEAGRTDEVTVRLDPQPLLLDEIEVETGSRCEVRPETGRLTARLWEDVSKALHVAEWSDSEGLLRFRFAEWARELSPERLSVLSEERRENTRFLRSSPFKSRPAAELQRLGYVQEGPDGGLSYYAPDADVLLSDVFLDSHCFRATTDHAPEEGWVGLAFEPVERSEVADVEGVLWVDGTTSELKQLEYGYTQLPEGVRNNRIGGLIDFDQVPEGPWIIRRWTIRMPHIGLRTTYDGFREAYLMGLKEAGGEVLEVQLPDGSALAGAGSATLSGTVFDSVAGGPLPGATVRLAGTDFVTIADARGRFAMDGLPVGSYGVVFEAFRLDELPWAPSPVPVELRAGDVATVELAIPPLERVLAEGCHVTVEGPGRSVVLGRATAPGGSELPGGAEVRVTWQENQLIRQSDGAVHVSQREMSANTSVRPGGLYNVCGLPEQQWIELRVAVGEREGASMDVRLSRGEIREVNLEGPARR